MELLALAIGLIVGAIVAHLSHRQQPSDVHFHFWQHDEPEEEEPGEAWRESLRED